MKKVLVTGASGFVGQRLLARLAVEKVAVKAVCRDQQIASSNAFAEWVSADLEETGFDFQDLCRGCDAVIHLAGMAHAPWATAAEYALKNADVTRRLVEAAAAAGVGQFLFMSTAKVFGEGYPPKSGREGYSEEDTPAPRDDYAASKLAAERAVLATTKDSRMHCTILRPPLIYGPGVRANFLQLMGIVEKGVPLPLASVDNRRSLIFVDNLCDLIYRILAVPVETNRVYGVSDVMLSTPELIRTVAVAMDVPPRLFPLPVPFLRLAGRLTGRGEVIDRLTQSFVVDDTAVRREFDWEPPISLEEGMEMTAKWYKNSYK